MKVFSPSDDQQLELLQSWWVVHGRKVLGAILATAAVVFGVNFYQDYRAGNVAEAALEYRAFMQFLDSSITADGDAVEALEAESRSRAEALVENSGNTIYGDFARLHLARLAVENDDLEAAESQLRQVASATFPFSDLLSSDIEKALRGLSRLRLAWVLLAQGERIGEVIELAESNDILAYASAFEEVRGDALLERGELEAAIYAYEQAVDSPATESEGDRIRMKLVDVRGKFARATAIAAAEARARAAAEAAEGADSEAEQDQ